jgi:hypothetical protein
MAQIDMEQHQEVSFFTLKFKGSRGVKNLQCSINYDARDFGSSRDKGKECPCCGVMVSKFCGLVPVGVFGFAFVFGFCRCFFFFLSFSCFGVLFVYFMYA